MNKISSFISRQRKLIVLWILLAVSLILAWQLTRYSIRTLIVSNAYTKPEAITDFEKLNEYDVYNAVITSRFLDATTELVLVENQTGVPDFFLDSFSDPDKPYFLTDTEGPMWADFVSKNKTRALLTPSFSFDKPYLLVDMTERENLNRLLLLTANIETTPFLEVSRVGFNTEKDEAILHISVVALGDRFLHYLTFAYGKYIYLQKINGTWVIREEWRSYIT